MTLDPLESLSYSCSTFKMRVELPASQGSCENYKRSVAEETTQWQSQESRPKARASKPCHWGLRKHNFHGVQSLLFEGDPPPQPQEVILFSHRSRNIWNQVPGQLATPVWPQQCHTPSPSPCFVTSNREKWKRTRDTHQSKKHTHSVLIAEEQN